MSRLDEYNYHRGNDLDNFAYAEFEQGRSYLRDNWADPMRDELLACIAELEAERDALAGLVGDIEHVLENDPELNDSAIDNLVRSFWTQREGGE